MEIRKSAPPDLPRILEIYAGARAFMAAHGNPRQWGATGWPPESLIRQDIAAGDSYVCLDGEEIAAVFFFRQGRDVEPAYRDIQEGRWIGDDVYGVVHRIAADSRFRGAGSFCIDWAFSRCGHLRMDTHGDNTVMQRLLTKLGFRYCGIIHVEEDDDPRLAYETLPDTQEEMR